jgi:predicted DsbA family dithiol-disulfide isomerase
MGEVKDTVDFYWDVVCPWCWITSRWMEDVASQRSIEVNWKFFSLKKINEGRDLPERFKISHGQGLRALRVAAAVRETYGNEGVRKLYAELGAQKHHDEADVGQTSTLEAALKNCGFPTELAAAADDEATWDAVIDADMEAAKAKAGTDVGVPLIVLDGGEGPGFFGPVFSPAPTGDDALKMWDAMVTAGRVPGFFEFKRSRDVGPIFGERPRG